MYIGQTYGPFQGKLMNCFLDDIHLPTQDKNNNMSEVYTYMYMYVCELKYLKRKCLPQLQYLRQLVDVKGLYNLSRDQEWSNIEDIVIFSNGSDSSKEMTLRNSRLRVKPYTITMNDNYIGTCGY